MKSIKISDESHSLLSQLKDGSGIEITWLASRCILDHAKEYVKR